MLSIAFPEKKPVLKKEKGKEFILCVIRKRWILLTPEEWVRQNFLLFLIEVMQFPGSLIAVEKKIKVGDRDKRFDILVYDRNTKPFMVVECKEMEVVLSKSVLHQVLQYNIALQAPYLIITNGTFCYGYKNIAGVFEELQVFPFSQNS